MLVYVRETDRQRQPDRQRQRQTEAARQTETEIYRHRQTDRQIDRGPGGSDRRN